VYQGARVPEELLSGTTEHPRWRLKQALGGPGSGGRPAGGEALSEEETKLLAEFQKEYRS